MALTLILLIPFLGGLVSFAAPRQMARWIAILAVVADLALLLYLAQPFLGDFRAAGPDAQEWWLATHWAWVPQFGIQFHLAMDGLSFLMAFLTLGVGMVALLFLTNEVTQRQGSYYFCILSTLSGILGVFLALDLFLFYVFWEVMVIPMYFLIHIWGAERRSYAAIKFFLYTQASGLLMFLAIIALYLINGNATGTYTFDYGALLGMHLSPSIGMLLMLGFFAAFAVKMPLAPFHGWQPDAYTCAPTGATVILAAIMGKTAAYGLLRFVLPLFPEAVAAFTPVAMVLAIFSILYGAVLAFGQRDIKRFIAYTSVSHMGMILLGIFAGNQQGISGSVLQILCHGLSVAGLFLLVGSVTAAILSRDLSRMGGFWLAAPRVGAFALFFALATLGLPGLGTFTAEFLILLGSFRQSIPIASVAMGGVVLAAIYSLYLIQQAFQGELKKNDEDEASSTSRHMPDLHLRPFIVLLLFAIPLIILGFYPQPVLRLVDPLVESIVSGSVAAPLGVSIAEGGALSRVIEAGGVLTTSLQSAVAAVKPLAALLPLLILAGAVCLQLVALCIRRSHGLMVFITAAGLCASFLSLFYAVSLDLPLQVTSLLLIDSFSLFYAGLIITATLAVALLGACYLRTNTREREEFYLLLVLACIGGVVLAASSSFASFFLGLEILSVSLIALIGFLHDFRRSVEAGIKFLVIASVSSAFLLFGMALLYAQYGSLSFAAIASTIGMESPSLLAFAGMALMIVGIGFKLALAPFHMWAADVYEGAPAPVTALIATVSKCAVFALTLRLFSAFGASLPTPVFTLFAVLAVASMFAGNLLALLQHNVKRLLAYSSIAHLGYATIAFLASGAMAATAVTYYLVVYTLTSLVSFGVVTVLSRESEEASEFSQYRGLAWRHPVMALLLTIALLSLAGIPLTAGFVGKYLVVAAGGSSSLWILMIILLANSALGLVYYLRLAGNLYLPLPEDNTGLAAPCAAEGSHCAWAGKVILVVLAAVVVWAGVYPGPLLQLVQHMIARI